MTDKTMPEELKLVKVDTGFEYGIVYENTHDGTPYVRRNLVPQRENIERDSLTVTDEAKKNVLYALDMVLKNELNPQSFVVEFQETIRAALQTETSITQPYVAGDGYIYDGAKWIKVAPSMESHAVVKLNKELEALRASHAELLEALKEILMINGESKIFNREIHGVCEQAIIKAQNLQEGK